MLFIFSYYNTLFSMTHSYSNYPVLLIFSTTLDSAVDLAHCDARVVFPLVFKHIYRFHKTLVLYFYDYFSWEVCKFNNDCFDLVTIFINIMGIFCTVSMFPWGDKLLTFYIILQICVKLVIFAWTIICLCGYWLLVW